MPCNIVIAGRDFDVDNFLIKSNLRGFSKSYKGEPIFKSKPQGRKVEHSKVWIETSKAEFDELNLQIRETVKYLKRNKAKLKHIKKFKNIEIAVLDFGINLRIDGESTLMQSDRYPNELLKLAGELGLDIETSIYPITLEEQIKKRKK